MNIKAVNNALNLRFNNHRKYLYIKHKQLIIKYLFYLPKSLWNSQIKSTKFESYS